MKKEPIETFDSLTLPIRNFVAWATGLPKSVSEWVLIKDEELLHIKLNIGIYLSNNAYYQQLECWCNLLNNITNEKIEDAFLYECYNKGLNKTPIEIFEESLQDEEYENEMSNYDPFNMTNVDLKWDAAINQRDKIKHLIINILQTHKKLTPKSISKSTIKYSGELLYLENMREALIKYGMIDKTPYFSEILRGVKNDRKINWKMANYALHYFIDELFKTRFFSGHKWEFTKNNFTIKGQPAPENIGRVNKDDIKEDNQIIVKINTVIDNLKKQTFSLALTQKKSFK